MDLVRTFLSIKFVVIVVSYMLSVYSTTSCYDNDPCFSSSFVVINKGSMTTNDKEFYILSSLERVENQNDGCV